MKTSLCTFLLLCAGMTGYAQKADSLERVLLNTTADTSKTILLSQLADELTVSNPVRSLEKARQGLALARRIGFAKGIFENHYSLASSFRGQALFDSAVTHFRHAYNVALSRNDLSAQADACSSLGHCFMRKSEHDSARHYLDKGLALAKKAGDFRVEAGIYNNYGNILLEESNYQKALDYFVQAARLYEHPLADDYGQCLALSNIGNIQYRLGNYEHALDYAGQSMAIARRRSFKPSIGYAHKLLGRIYRKQGKFDAALEEYRQAQKLFITMNDRRSEAEVLQNIGNIYFDKEQHRDALVNYLESLRLARSTASKPLIAGDYSCIGQAYLVLKKYDAALRYLDSSRVAATAIGNGYLLMDNYGAISEVYEAKGDYKKALAMHHRYTELKDSVTQSENRALAEETQAKYELEKKEAQIALLEKDQELTSLALEAHRTVQAGAVVAALLVIIIAALLVNRYRISNQVKRLAEIERMRNAIARDLHDDIGSTLSTINIISQLAMREETRSSDYLGRIAEQSSQMMENMTDMVWSINPGNDSLAKVVVKMKVFTGEILEPRNIRYRFAGEESLNGVVLDADKRKNLFLIFKEAINNAAKYSGATEVEITLKQSDKKMLMLQIADNGNGFDTGQVQHGNGLNNMEARAKALNAQFRLTSVASQGTRISLDMPIT